VAYLACLRECLWVAVRALIVQTVQVVWRREEARGAGMDREARYNIGTIKWASER